MGCGSWVVVVVVIMMGRCLFCPRLAVVTEVQDAMRRISVILAVLIFQPIFLLAEQAATAPARHLSGYP